MKKRMKVSISMVLMIALIVTSTVTAFASTKGEESKAVMPRTEAEIQKEIAEKQQEVMSNVYEQLEEQDRLDFFKDYEEILLPEIEAEVRNQYTSFSKSLARAVTKKYTYWYGGSIANTTVSGKNALCTYLDRNNSYYHILSSKSYTVSPIVEAILGSLPQFGAAFTIMFTLKTIANGKTCDEIRNSNGCTKTITLRDPVTRDYSSVLLAWDTYPTASTYAVDESKKIQAKEFPEYDPFKQ